MSNYKHFKNALAPYDDLSYQLPVLYEGVTRCFRTGRLERELQMVQFSATKCSCIAILWVSLVSFAAITLCVASQRARPKVSVYFVIDSVRKLSDTPSYSIKLVGYEWWIQKDEVAPYYVTVISCPLRVKKSHMRTCLRADIRTEPSE
jgi:hypothetical protein